MRFDKIYYLTAQEKGVVMRKFFLYVAAFGLCIVIPAASCWAADMYFSAKAGLSMLDDSDFKPAKVASIDYELEDGTESTLEGDSATAEFDWGPAIAFAIGGAVSDRIRIETEVGYQENDFDEMTVSGISTGPDEYVTEQFKSRGDMSSLSLMLNGYYDFVNNTPLTPFVTMGMGLARLEAGNLQVEDNYQEGDSNSVFAYQFGTGLAWEIDEQIAIDFTYRYFATKDARFDFGDVEYASDNFYVGLRTKF